MGLRAAYVAATTDGIAKFEIDPARKAKGAAYKELH